MRGLPTAQALRLRSGDFGTSPLGSSKAEGTSVRQRAEERDGPASSAVMHKSYDEHRATRAQSAPQRGTWATATCASGGNVSRPSRSICGSSSDRALLVIFTSVDNQTLRSLPLAPKWERYNRLAHANCAVPPC